MKGPEVPIEKAHEDMHHAVEKHGHSEKWILGVALTAAIFAVFAAITALKAEHAANEAMLCQIKSSNQWNFYQAKSIKSYLFSTKVEILTALDRKASEKDLEKIEEYKKEQAEIMEKAKEYQEESGHYLREHLVLAKSVTLFQIAIAVGAISALTRRRAFWYVCIVFGIVGTALFIQGILTV